MLYSVAMSLILAPVERTPCKEVGRHGGSVLKFSISRSTAFVALLNNNFSMVRSDLFSNLKIRNCNPNRIFRLSSFDVLFFENC